MKKSIIDVIIAQKETLGDNYALIKLSKADGTHFSEMVAGQFVEVAIPGAGILLRRPISVNYIDQDGLLWLLVRRAGRGTNHLADMLPGGHLNIVGPLGNGFTIDINPSSCVLLCGGGVGVAPLLYLGKKLKDAGIIPTFLLGARNRMDLLEIDQFNEIGPVKVSTEDGSAGEKGLITSNSAFETHWDKVYCCGPAPMMKAVARICRRLNTECEVSLENMMACGLGACLCCVEKTVKGNVCVCTDGPVFNINELTW